MNHVLEESKMLRFLHESAEKMRRATNTLNFSKSNSSKTPVFEEQKLKKLFLLSVSFKVTLF